MKYTRIEEKDTTNTLLPQSGFYPMPEIEIYDSPEYFAITNKLSELKDPNDKKALRDNLDINWKNIQGDVALSTSLVNYINNPDNYWSTTVLNKVFKSFKTKAEFETNLDKGKINLNLIIFIEDTKDIWTQNTYYHCPYSHEELVSLIIKLCNENTKTGINVTNLFTKGGIIQNKTLFDLASNHLYTIGEWNTPGAVVTFHSSGSSRTTSEKNIGFLTLTKVSNNINLKTWTSTIEFTGNVLICREVVEGIPWLPTIDISLYAKNTDLPSVVSVSKNGLMPSTMLGITVGENNLKDYVVVKHNWNNRLLIPKVSQTVDGLMSFLDKKKLDNLKYYDYSNLEKLLSSFNGSGNINISELLSLFLSKTTEDSAEKLINFKEGLTAGNYQKGSSGATIEIDDNGNSYLEVDYASFRKKAIFNEIDVRSLKHVGGVLIISAASGKIDVVVENKDANGNVESYTCFIKNKDSEGNTLNNEWVVRDLAKCLKFGIPEGSSTNVQTKYYWRKVIDSNVLDNNYINTHFGIKLSNKEGEYDVLSDVPKAGDEIALFGHIPNNLNNVTPDEQARAAAIVLSAYDINIGDIKAPCLILYSDIYDFSLKDKAQQIISPNKNVFKGNVTITGGSGLEKLEDSRGQTLSDITEDFIKNSRYLVQTETPSIDSKYKGYLWYNPDENELKILIQSPENLLYEWQPFDNAVLGSIFETIDASVTTLNDKINGFSETVKELNKKLDGEVSNWFYEGSPTLDNQPANAWLDFTACNNAIGDTYTNVEKDTATSGKSWRWIRTEIKPTELEDEGVTYKSFTDDSKTYYFYWLEISDSEASQALAKASEALDALDGKISTYLLVEEPDANKCSVGDLWILPEHKTFGTTTYKKGTILVWTGSNWENKISYLDESLVKDIYDKYLSDIENLIEDVKQSSDQKANIYYLETEPVFKTNTYYGTSSTEEHKNDMWYNPKNKRTYIYDGTKWVDMDVTIPQDLLDKVDGKTEIFTQLPGSYNKGDLWIISETIAGSKLCPGYYVGEDFIKAQEGDLYRSVTSNTKYTIADWVPAFGYARSTDLEDLKKSVVKTNLLTAELKSLRDDLTDAMPTTASILNNLINNLTYNKELLESIGADNIVSNAELKIQEAISNYNSELESYKNTLQESLKDGIITEVESGKLKDLENNLTTLQNKINTLSITVLDLNAASDLLNKSFQGTSQVDGGVMLTNTMLLGSYDESNLDSSNATCGINGRVSNLDTPAFWAGGTWDDACKGTAKCIITHEGQALFKNAVVEGSIHANDGYFKGSVYADDGYFKGTVNATDGIFENGYFENVVISGTYNRRILHINKDNYKEFFVEDIIDASEINLYPLLHTWGDVIYIDFEGLYDNLQVGSVTIKFPYYFPQTNLSGVYYEKELGFIINNGELNSATVKDIRSLLGKKIMIYTKNTPGGILKVSCPCESKTSVLSNWTNPTKYYSGKVTKESGSWNETKNGDFGYILNSNTLTLRSENCYILECILAKRECRVQGSDNSTDSDDIKGWFEMLAWTSEELTAADKYIDNWYRCVFYKYYESTGKSEFVTSMDAERGWTWNDAYESAYLLGSLDVDIDNNSVVVRLYADYQEYYVCSDTQGTRVKPTDKISNIYYLSKKK